MTQPISQSEHLLHSASLPQAGVTSPDLWTEVHEQVQRQLAILESEVRGRVPAIHVDEGRTKGAHFHLFSFRTFSLPSSGLDPVVSGILFKATSEGVAIEADVSGEQSGDGISPVHRRVVTNSREELLTAARELANELASSADAIDAALKDPSRRVE